MESFSTWEESKNMIPKKVPIQKGQRPSHVSTNFDEDFVRCEEEHMKEVQVKPTSIHIKIKIEKGLVPLKGAMLVHRSPIKAFG